MFLISSFSCVLCTNGFCIAGYLARIIGAAVLSTLEGIRNSWNTDSSAEVMASFLTNAPIGHIAPGIA